MKRSRARVKVETRKKAKFSPAKFIKISGLTTLANSIVCDQCSKLVRGEEMFTNEKDEEDLCMACFERNTQQIFTVAPALCHDIPEGEVKNGCYCCWEGDTISRIARKVNMKVPKIVSMNAHIPNLTGRTRLEAGTVLKVSEEETEIVKQDDGKHAVNGENEETVRRYTKMTSKERTTRMNEILTDLCSEKYHSTEKIDSYYKELNYFSTDDDRAVKIWVLRAKIREELGDVTSYLKSFVGGNKYTVYWDAAEPGEKLWYSCFLLDINFFNGNAELMWENEDDIIEYNLNHLWVKPVVDAEEQPSAGDGA